MTTAERLEQYHVFDPEVVEAVAEVAEEQAPYSFQELADRYGVGDGPQKASPYGDRRSLGYYELTTPQVDREQYEPMVYHTPMAMPADKSMAARAFRLAALLPETPIMVVGNPSLLGVRENRVLRKDRFQIALGDLSPMSRLVLKHLSNQGVERAQFAGYSFGADLAVTSAAAADNPEFNIEATNGVFMEPGSVAVRSMTQLLKDFKSAEPQLANYVQAANSQMLNEARDPGAGLKPVIDFVRYVGGLARPTNLAVARALAHGGFWLRASHAMLVQPEMKATLAWGSASELVPERDARDLADFMTTQLAPERVTSLEIPGMHHAGGDDIDLHAAIVLQAIYDQDKLSN